MAVVLEGGYSLEALEISSESVIKTLQTDPKDSEAFNAILEEYGAPEETNTYEKLVQQALMYPRYSFRVTASNISKLIKKQWGKVVEDLIFEKPRRKSSAQSKKSSNNDYNSEIASTGHVKGRDRINSMDEKIYDTNTSLAVQKAKSENQRSKDELAISAKKSSLIQVDDPIDETEEIVRDAAKKKKGK